MQFQPGAGKWQLRSGVISERPGETTMKCYEFGFIQGRSYEAPLLSAAALQCAVERVASYQLN
jgi:hypothetical protein